MPAPRKRARPGKLPVVQSPLTETQPPLTAQESIDSLTSHSPPVFPASPDGVGHCFAHRRQSLLSRLSPLFIPPSLPGLSSPHSSLFAVLDRTLTSKSNNAALLIGYAGSGKSAVTQSVLLDLHRRHSPHGRSFTTVRLNGRIHSDDTAAMREIVRQLTVDLEMESAPTNADFATLLAYLKDILTSSLLAGTPVFFILDHFDLFAVNKAKQTLLYNLCNLLQEDYQLAIVALSQRLDCFDLLEKRIKSRLTAQRLHFTPCKEEGELVDILAERLTLTREGIIKALGKRSRHDVDYIPGEIVGGIEDVEGLSAAVQSHNDAVHAVLKDKALLGLLRHHINLGRSVRWFLTWVVGYILHFTQHPTDPRSFCISRHCDGWCVCHCVRVCDVDECSVSDDPREAVSHRGSLHVSDTAYRHWDTAGYAPSIGGDVNSLAIRCAGRALCVMNAEPHSVQRR